MKKGKQSFLKRRPRPLPFVITADFLMFAICLSVFCYFHHIRDLWELAEPSVDGMEPIEVFEPSDPEVSDSASLDYGDFGAAFPEVFLNGSPVRLLLENDEEIRGYIAENKLPGRNTIDSEKIAETGTEFLGLYRSNDIYMTAEKVSGFVEGNAKKPITVYIYDVYIKNLENLFTVASSERKMVMDMANASYQITSEEGETFITSPAILAISGDHWGNDKLNYFAIRNNMLLRENDFLSTDICMLLQDGSLKVIVQRDFSKEGVMSLNPYQLWEFGPSLLTSAGVALDGYHANFKSFLSHSLLTARHPRASIGYYEPGHYCFVVADGRSEQSVGLYLTELGKIYESLGCRFAYNLDGGDTAQSIFNFKENRVDEERIKTGEGQRTTYDIICIGEVTKK